MAAYYNEHDPKAVAWLRELIAQGLIAPGVVDGRDIQEVVAADLRGFDQCHFFAGIGGWSLALRSAGWADARPVWTGSCPCQPFSSAGKQQGADDPRHLWPEWYRLIAECRPPTIFGEQVSAAIQHGWWDAVAADLEGAGYAVGAASLPAAGVGAFHKRDRLWFVGELDDAAGARRDGARRGAEGQARDAARLRGSESGCEVIFVAESESAGGRSDLGAVRDRQASGLRDSEGQDERRAVVEAGRSVDCGAVGGVADAMCESSERRAGELSRAEAAIRGAREFDGCGADGFTDGSEVIDLADTDGGESLLQPAEDAAAGELANTEADGLRQGRSHNARRTEGTGAQGTGIGSTDDCEHSNVGIASLARLEGLAGHGDDGNESGRIDPDEGGSVGAASGDVIWIPCTDGKSRAVEWLPESAFVGLADGLSNRLGYVRADGGYILAPRIEKGEARVMRLRGYGNAIDPRAAAAFIVAYTDSTADRDREAING